MVLWVRSYRSYDSLEYDISHYAKNWEWRYCTFSYNKGELYSTFGHHHTDKMSSPALGLSAPEGRHYSFRANGSTVEQMWITEEAGTLIEWRGLYLRLLQSHDTGWYENTLCVGMPAWSLVLLAGLLPFRSVVARMRLRFRSNYGLCLTCSYNLIGNTSNICPECGTAIKSKDVPTKMP